jgi:hypothetical protein
MTELIVEFTGKFGSIIGCRLLSTNKKILVKADSKLFSKFESGDCLALKGDWTEAEDLDGPQFRVMECKSIYSEKVRDVLGE